MESFCNIVSSNIEKLGVSRNLFYFIIIFFFWGGGGGVIEMNTFI